MVVMGDGVVGACGSCVRKCETETEYRQRQTGQVALLGLVLLVLLSFLHPLIP